MNFSHSFCLYRFCDSPTSDIENRSTKSCGRPKRGRASNNSNNNDMSNFTETRSSIHSKLRNSSTVKGRKGASANGNRTSPVEKPQGKRKHRPSEVSASSGEDSKSAKRLKSSNNAKQNNVTPSDPVPDSNGLIECPEPNCSKKYKHINGLRYHRQHAHQEDKPDDDNEDDDQDSENKSSSDESSCVSTPVDSVKSKDWNDSNRTSDTSSNDTKVSSVSNGLTVEQTTAEKQRQQYSTAAAHAAATAAANAAAAAANLELLHKEDSSNSAGKKGHKLSSDKTSPKILHGTLGKSKDATLVKSKGDASEKTGGKPKKGSSSTEKDLSVFDFNSTVDSDSVPEPLGSEKHVSVIRPIADMSTTSSPSKESIATPAKLQDVIHTTALPGSEHLEELQKHSKRSEKDKSKSGDRKKGKHDKVPSSKVKPSRPVTASPTPPQLGTAPANMAAKGAVTTATTQPIKMPPTNGKHPINPALKQIQPKPTVLSEGSGTKEKKSKSKKKSKDKDKEREKTSSSAKEKESKDSLIVNNKQNIQPQQSSAVKQQLVAPAIALPVAVPKHTSSQQPGTVLPETNILHQALTQSGITPEDAERNSPSVTGSGDIPKTDTSGQAPKDQSKDVRSLFPNRPPMHGNIPEIPKLIPTSSVVNSSGRAVGPMPPHMPSSHPTKPVPPVQDTSQMDKSTLPMPQMKANLLQETDSNSQTPPTGQNDERAQSPAAYSDISDANEENEVPPSKTLNDRDPYSFQDAARNQAKVAPSRDEPHIHSKSLYTPLSEVGRDRLPDGRLPEGMPKPQQDSHRTAAPPLIHPPFKGDGGSSGGKEGNHAEGPDAKKPRKDTSSPRLPPSSEAGYNRPPSQSYPGQYPPYMSPGFVMDPQYHMHLLNTDHHYRQQHEQFRQEQRQLSEKERMERERNAKDKPPAPGSSKPQEESKERTIPRIKTEPITPPKRPVLTEKGQERGKPDRPPSAEKLKRKQLDFTNKSGSENVVAATEASSDRPVQEDVSRSKAFMHQQHQEEMRQYLLYQQKVQEQKYEEEQRRKLEESRANPESVSSQKEKENRTEREESPSERHRSGASPSLQHNPPKSRSPCPPSDDKKLRGSPSASSPSPMSKDPKGIMSSSSSRKVLDYPAYLQHTPYGPVPMHQTPYGAIPIDPNHPAYQHPVNPLIYQAYLSHGHYPGPVVSPMWKSDEKGHEYERGRAASPHQASSSRGPSPSEPPPKALDLLQQHASRYYSSHKHDRSRSPDKSRPSSPQRRPASPRKSPETSSSSRERVEPSHRSEQPMVHQHMHTHQHTHVGYPAVLPPYDPFGKSTLLIRYRVDNQEDVSPN